MEKITWNTACRSLWRRLSLEISCSSLSKNTWQKYYSFFLINFYAKWFLVSLKVSFLTFAVLSSLLFQNDIKTMMDSFESANSIFLFHKTTLLIDRKIALYFSLTVVYIFSLFYYNGNILFRILLYRTFKNLELILTKSSLLLCRHD